MKCASRLVGETNKTYMKCMCVKVHVCVHTLQYVGSINAEYIREQDSSTRCYTKKVEYHKLQSKWALVYVCISGFQWIKGLIISG